MIGGSTTKALFSGIPSVMKIKDFQDPKNALHFLGCSKTTG